MSAVGPLTLPRSFPLSNREANTKCTELIKYIDENLQNSMISSQLSTIGLIKEEILILLMRAQKNFSRFKNIAPGILKLLYTDLLTINDPVIKIYGLVKNDLTLEFYLKIKLPNDGSLMYSIQANSESIITEIKDPSLFQLNLFYTRLAHHNLKRHLRFLQKNPPSDLKTLEQKELNGSSSFYWIRKTLNGEVQAYARKKNSSQYRRLDSPNKHLYQRIGTTLLNLRAISFLDKLRSTMNKIEKKKFTILEPRIPKEKLLNFFTYMLNSNEVLYNLSTEKPFKIPKRNSNLLYTMNVIIVDNAYRLIVKTKNGANNLINPLRTLAKTAFSTVRRAFSIDSPEVWIDKNTSYSVSEFIHSEAKFTHLISTSPYSEKICTQFPGKGYNNISGFNYDIKKSLFSLSATLTLEDLLRNDRGFCCNENKIEVIKSYPKYFLNLEEKNIITLDILEAIKSIHKKGIIHQDIKPANILLYQQIEGTWRAKIADFGISEHPEFYKTQKPLAAKEYESPQISSAYSRPDKNNELGSHYRKMHSFYHPSEGLSLAHYVIHHLHWDNMKNEDYFPNQSNDMWALGIVLYELYYSSFFDKNKDEMHLNNIDTHPLISRLLSYDSNERPTAAQAILIQKEIMQSSKVESSFIDDKKHPLTFSHQASTSASSSSQTQQHSVLSHEEIEFLIAHTSTRYSSLSKKDKNKYCMLLSKCFHANQILLEYILNSHLEETIMNFLKIEAITDVAQKMLRARKKSLEAGEKSSLEFTKVPPFLYDVYLADEAFDRILIYLQQTSKHYLKF